ncbi:MAG: hypothetical protein FJ290_01130 [Planctomycetes bacterium]|nr:hypothetical protein [Planctomycetota bacterium]
MAPGKRTRLRAPAGPPADPQTATIYAMMAQADKLYKLGRYRRALAVCQELARFDPKNALPEQMIEGCRRELRTRRLVLISVLAALAAVGVAVALVYNHLSYIRPSPYPGTVRLRERQAQAFEFRSPLGYHKSLEYAWQLLDGDGKPVPPTEEGTLAPREGAPWARTYTPAYSLVRGDAGTQPVVRRIVAAGTSASGREALRAEWVVEVVNAPLAPRVLSISPPTDDPLAIVAGQGERTFRVEAADGDGAADLLYEWSVAGKAVHKGREPAWTYRPPADALPPGTTGREVPPAPPVPLVCQVSNRYGEPMPATVQWRLRFVRSNAPPQLISFEPEMSDLVRILEGERRSVTVTPYDPDDKAETLTYVWDCGGRVISRRPKCPLWFPHDFTDSERTVRLTLTVTDPCGATATRSWQLHVVNALPPTSPPSY